MTDVDILVVGAGIAGASVAAHLAARARVALVEMEPSAGYHTTGRSAAIFSPVYGPAPIRALTRASAAFMAQPPEGFADTPLLKPIDAVFIARADQGAALAALRDDLGDAVAPIAADALEARVPLLRKGYAHAGLIDRTTQEIDVAALHQGYLRLARARGAQIALKAEVTGLGRDGAAWRAETAAGDFRAGCVVNAAGAWADRLGQMAGAEPIGLVPKRRTALTIAAPEGTATQGLPLVVDVEELFYLKPDAGRLLISPANEDPDSPGDAQPDEMDVALCIDRIETAFELRVRRIESRWAGLRSFVADKSPVAGWSGRAPGFYWLAGQGGYGIQSAAALSRFAAAQVLGDPVPQDILDEGLDPARLSPARL